MLSIRRRFTAPLLGLGLALTSVLGGCVSQGEYDRLYEVNASVTAQNKDQLRQIDEKNQAIALLQKSSLSGDTTVAGLQRQNADLRNQLAKALASLKDLEARVAGMDFGPLDANTDRALTLLADQFPDLIKYDAARGMLRFASDLTFDSGSARVKDNARAAIDALSKILTSSSASGYDVVIEGHTDSQRISANTARNHPTNRHLSAHRSISVIDELAKLGVPHDRMLAAGWGEWRPLVANSANGNTPQNRRVEIFLAKARGTGTTPTTTDEPASMTTEAHDDIDITK